MEDRFYEEAVKMRHDLHRHPELSWEEYETTAYIREQLAAWGIRTIDIGLETGVIAELGFEGGRTVALRADIDALPIQEETGLTYASEIRGKMHACGHDIHTAALLEAAKILKERERELRGRVRLIFQPAEESGTGAETVIKRGGIAGVDAIVGFHNHPGYPVGIVALRAGGIMAGVEHFQVTVRGIGSHGAEPHRAKDVIPAVSFLVGQLQTILSRNVSADDSAVLSVTRMEAGNTWNVIPDTAFLEGTIRTFSKETGELMRRRLEEIVSGVCMAFELEGQTRWLDCPDVTWSDPCLTEKAKTIAQRFAQVREAKPSYGGEDFSSYTNVIPGVFAFIGSNGSQGASGWHQKDFIAEDETLKTAISFYVEHAIDFCI